MSTTPLQAPPQLRLRYDAGSSQLRALTFEVEVLEKGEAPRVVELDGVTVVGTDPACGLRLGDDTVSRRHLELEPRSDGVLVRDLGSMNGTRVGGIRVQAAIVEGATVELGRTLLKVKVKEVEIGHRQISRFGDAVGQSAAMQNLFGLLDRAATSSATVLLTGETGTGKGLLAQALHGASSRSEGPFVVVDCGALSPSLAESELFGHAAGAFTGAVGARKGAFAGAHGGTVFLDEIGELPLELQPKLLRVLETGEVKPVGSNETPRFDFRVVAATHRDLEADVKKGRFRQDLFYRLAVVSIRVPALRERLEDLLPLVRTLAARSGKDAFEPGPALLERLVAYDWPGNVRELRNVIDRTLAGDTLVPEAVGGAPEVGFKEAKERVIEAFSREYLARLFEKHKGNVSQIARVAGINRNHVQLLLERYGLKPRD